MDILKFGLETTRGYGQQEWANNDEWWGIDTEADFDDDNKTYYYVRYYANKVQFKPHDGHQEQEQRPFDFKNTWLKQIADFTEKETIWGVRSNQLSKIKAKKNWVCLDDVYEDLVFKDEKVVKYVQYYNETSLFADYCPSTMHKLDKLQKSTMNENLKNLLNSYTNWVGNKTIANTAKFNHQYVLDRLKPRNLSAKSSARKKAFDTAFPMAKYALQKSHTQDVSKSISDVLSYIG